MKIKKYLTPIPIGLSLAGGLLSLSASAVDGDDVLASDAPYMAYLRSSSCSGALIAPKTVLTAHHCRGASSVYLLHSRGPADKNGFRPHLGIQVNVVQVYTPPLHIFMDNNQVSKDGGDDIAILELESMPEGATFLPVAQEEIDLGADIYPIGYETAGVLRRMPAPAIVAAKEHSPDYLREVAFSRCHDSKYHSHQYFTQRYQQATQEQCKHTEIVHEHAVEKAYYRPNRYSITIENPPLHVSDPRREVNEFGTVITKYSAFSGDSGSPLIYQDKIYGVLSLVANGHSQLHNPAAFYAGFTRPGVYNWIVDTVRKIQPDSVVKTDSDTVLDAPVTFSKSDVSPTVNQSVLDAPITFKKQ